MKKAQQALRSIIATLLCAVITATPAMADCANVTIRTERMLDLGTVRSLPAARGFLQLKPRHGISISAQGVTHTGPSGTAQVVISGPVGSEVDLRVEAQRLSDHNTSRLTLVELIAYSGTLHQRIAPTGGHFTITLPARGDAEGQARRKVEFGAVMRFQDAQRQETARYRLTTRCVKW